MAITVRQLIAEAQSEIRDSGELAPERSRVLLAHLSALLGNVNDEIRRADAAYADVLLTCLNTEAAANRAKVRAECSPEYQRKREARDAKEVLLEMVRSLKYLLRSQEEEMRLAGRS